MSEFTRGIVFTIGAYMFGKGLYDLGQRNQKRKDKKAWNELYDELNEMIDFLKEEEESE